jgi:hypothetical protein
MLLRRYERCTSARSKRHGRLHRKVGIWLAGMAADRRMTGICVASSDSLRLGEQAASSRCLVTDVSIRKARALEISSKGQRISF